MLEKSYQKFRHFFSSRFPSLYSVAFTYRRAVKYVIAGGTAAAVDIGILYILTDLAHIWYLLSAVLAFAVAFVVSFTLQKFWTFRDRSTENLHAQAGLYLAVALFNLCLNTALMYLLVDIFDIWYVFSQIFVGIFIASFSFFIYRIFVFKQPH
jgi:putative flippase GtrA